MKYQLDLLQQKHDNLQKKLWTANKEIIALKAKIRKEEILKEAKEHQDMAKCFREGRFSKYYATKK